MPPDDDKGHDVSVGVLNPSPTNVRSPTERAAGLSIHTTAWATVAFDVTAENYSFSPRSRSALEMTLTDEKLMAAAAIMGERSQPVSG